MSYYRRPENKLESLLRWRRNVFLQAPGGGYVLVSATRYLLTLHHFSGSLRHEPTHTEHRDPIPGLFDGNGWNLASLNSIESISPQNVQNQSEKTMSDSNQQPYAAFYCKPLRASIRNMSDVELRLFIAVGTYIGPEGNCFPGVRELADVTGLQPDEVSAGLESLNKKALLHYLRRNQRDQLTGKILPNVMTLTPQIFSHNLDSGFQTYMHEFLSPFFPSDHAQAPPEASSQPSSEALPITNASNHHHHPDALAREENKPPEGGRASALGKDYANQSPQPAAQPQPANAAKKPESDVPPPDAGPLDAYAVPLTAIDQEAYANEMRHLVSGLQLAKARQLVDVFGLDMCGIAVRLLAKQPFKSVDNPPGWLINKLRQGALVAADGKGQYDEFTNT